MILKNILKKIQLGIILFLILTLNNCDKKKEVSQKEIEKHNELKLEKNVDSLIIKFLKFKNEFPESEFLKAKYESPDDIETKIFNYCLKENSLFLWEKALPVIEYGNLMKYQIKIDRKLYDRLKIENDKTSINRYLDSLSNSKENSTYFITTTKEVQKLYENLEKKENDKLKNENYAWDYFNNTKTIESCKKYLEYHPNGKHKNEVIDTQVNLILQGDYGQLPSMNVVNGRYASQSKINLLNSTQYNLTVLYSGPSSKYVILTAGESKNIILKSGFYKISAYVDNYSVRKFAGSEDINFSNYSVEYYIQTTRY